MSKSKYKEKEWGRGATCNGPFKLDEFLPFGLKIFKYFLPHSNPGFCFSSFFSLSLRPSQIKKKLIELFVLRSKRRYCDIIFVDLMHTSVTRSGDLLDFGQLFKAFSNN